MIRESPRGDLPRSRRDPESKRAAARRSSRWFVAFFLVIALGWVVGALVGVLRQEWSLVLFALAMVALWAGIALWIYPRPPKLTAPTL